MKRMYFFPSEASCESQVCGKSGIITVAVLGSFKGIRIEGTNSNMQIKDYRESSYLVSICVYSGSVLSVSPELVHIHSHKYS